MLKRLTVFFALVFFIWLVWLGSFAYVNISYTSTEADASLSEVLFGASSIALTLVAFFLGVAALFGWQVVERSLKRIASETAQEMRISMENEYRGRMMSALGYFVGEVNKPDVDFTTAEDKKTKMKEAVDLCQQGFSFLKNTKGPGRYMALNNLVYYLCVYGDAGYREDFILRSAQELMEAGEENDSINVQLTACRAMLQYKGDAKRAAYAYSRLEEIAVSRDASESERKEAKRYLRHFSRPPVPIEGTEAIKKTRGKLRRFLRSIWNGGEEAGPI